MQLSTTAHSESTVPRTTEPTLLNKLVQPTTVLNIDVTAPAHSSIKQQTGVTHNTGVVVLYNL